MFSCDITKHYVVVFYYQTNPGKQAAILLRHRPAKKHIIIGFYIVNCAFISCSASYFELKFYRKKHLSQDILTHKQR